MTDLRFLDVPFDEKDIAKELGAKWHSKRKQWFVPEGEDTTKFAKWVPDYDETCNVRALAPFYLIQSFEYCYKCNFNSPVIAFGASSSEDLEGAELEEGDDNSEEPVKFLYVSVVPPNLAQYVKEKHPDFFLDWSNTTESFYYMNHCTKCSARLGDFFLHSEPDHAFFPQSPDDVKQMSVTELKSDGGVKLGATVSWGSMGFILEHTNITN